MSSPRVTATILGVFAWVAGADSAHAQSAEIRAVTSWRLQFTYSIVSTLRAGGLQFDYRVTASGNGVLEPESGGMTGFSGAPNITVNVAYMGSAIDEQGCGLSEQLTASGPPDCDNPTSLEFDPTGFALELRCHRVPVTHTFSWQGACGELFPYPVDGAPIVDWPWLAQDVVFDPGNVTIHFPYPASGVVLGGHDSVQLTGFLAPLYTAIAMGTPTPLDYTFDFTLTPAETEDLTLEISAAAYERWRPSAALPNGAGAPLDVTATLVSSTGRSPTIPVAEFIWELRDTSSEPGIAMNFPAAAMDDELDLRFAASADGTHVIQDRAQRATRTNPDGFSDTVGIEPHDWGGWSELSVTAVLQGGRQVVGRVRGAAEDGLRLPKRSASSFIADGWKQTNAVMGLADASDADAQPVGDATPGDGLTLYQEYRGFYVGDEHVTGDPKRKDFFVENRAKAAATAGIARFKRLSRLQVHDGLTRAQMTSARVINANRARGPSVADQHAVIIEVIAGQTGFAAARGGPGNPKTISSVQLMGDWATLDGVYLSKVVAHELFHTVNVYHHGETDEEVTWREAMGALVEQRGAGAGSQIRVLGESGVDATALMLARLGRLPGRAEGLWLGANGGQQSGAHDCVMRYNNANTYVSQSNASDRYLISQEMGPGLCSSPNGTGPNAPSHRPQSRFGAATEGRGNCRSQLLVTDAVAAPAR